MIISKSLSKFKNISHGFFGRKGGFSKGIYKSLNCGFGSFDKKKNIIKNIIKVCNKIKCDKKNLILLNQIHSNKFHLISDTKKLKNRNIGVLITDHNVRETLKIVDKVYIVNEGAIFFEGRF